MSFCLKDALDQRTASFPPKRGIYLVAISIISECAKGGEENPVKEKLSSVAYPILHVGVSMVYFLRTGWIWRDLSCMHGQILAINEFGMIFNRRLGILQTCR
jgi:hypothetical protein